MTGTTPNEAIMDALDVYGSVAREMLSGYETRAMVDRMMKQVGRGDEPHDRWPSTHRLACAAFIESLRQNGYELCAVGDTKVEGS